MQGDRSITIDRPSQIEGIGRPRVEPSFIPQVIDRMLRVPDVASIAMIHFLEQILGRRCGGSTGTNMYGAFQIAAEMQAQQEHGSVVSLICDSGERYYDTYYSEQWLAEHGYDIAPWIQQLAHFYQTGQWVIE
jgi:cysteine synthase